MTNISRNAEFLPMFCRSLAHLYTSRALRLLIVFVGLSLCARYLHTYISRTPYNDGTLQMKLIRQPSALEDQTRNVQIPQIVHVIRQSRQSVKSETSQVRLKEQLGEVVMIANSTSIIQTTVTSTHTDSLSYSIDKVNNFFNSAGFIPTATLINALMQSFNNCSSNVNLHKQENYNLTYFDLANRTEFCLNKGNDISEYITLYNGSAVRCYTAGTKGFDSGRGCICHEGWTGEWCSLPPSVTLSNYPKQHKLSLRATARRIIYVFPFNHEFDQFQNRLNYYKNAVDFYVIVESNFTTHGDPKTRYLRERMLKESDYLSEFRSKLIIAELDQFPKQGLKDGWIAEDVGRSFTVLGGVSRIRGIKSDDIIITSDADEIAVPETLYFLKHHDGYPEPIGFRLRFNVFSMRWLWPDPIWNMVAACTFGMLRHVYEGNPYLIRQGNKVLFNNKNVKRYEKKFGGKVYLWDFGSINVPKKFEKLENHVMYKNGSDSELVKNITLEQKRAEYNPSGVDLQGLAGYHCSWCFNTKDLLWKLHSVQVDDGPRWGDVIKKDDVNCVNYHVNNGWWFDNKTKLTPLY